MLGQRAGYCLTATLGRLQASCSSLLLASTIIGQDIVVEECMRQADGLCCTQKERMFAGNWMYKHIDTSMAIRQSKAKLSVPWPLDDRLLFKATQEDNRLYQMVNLVNTILRHAPLSLKQIAAK